MPDALPGALAFTLCQTQWQYAPSGVPTGLRYTDCLTLLEARRAEFGGADLAMSDAMAGLQAAEQAWVAARVECWKLEHPDGK